MEPVHYLRILGRRWPLIAACVVLAVIPAWMAAPAPTARPVRTFEATHTLIRLEDGPTPARSLARAALLTTTGEVPRRVAGRLGFAGDPAILAIQVQTTPDDDVGSLAIKVTNSDGKRAAEVANAFAEELMGHLASITEQTRQRALEQTVQSLNELQDSIKQLDAVIAGGGRPGEALDLTRAQRDAQVRQYGVSYERLQQLAVRQPGLSSSGFVTLQEATPIPIVRGGLAPPSSRPGRVAAAVAIGLVVGAGIALAWEHSKPRVRSTDAAEAAFQLPVVVEVPRTSRGRRRQLAVVDSPRSAVADAYRILRASLRFPPARPTAATPVTATPAAATPPPVLTRPPGPEDRAGGDGALVVMVTSAGAGDAKTTTTANLAAALAEAGRSVLVVDADLRQPRLHQAFGLPMGAGLVDVLRGDADTGSVVRTTGVPGVRIVTAGTSVANPAELLARHLGWVQQVRALADVVLVDTGAVLGSNEASELVPHADRVLLTVRIGHTRPVPAARTSELLARMGAAVVGVVVVGTRSVPRARWHLAAFGRSPSTGGQGAPPDAGEPATNGNQAGRGRAPVAPGAGAGSLAAPAEAAPAPRAGSAEAAPAPRVGPAEAAPGPLRGLRAWGWGRGRNRPPPARGDPGRRSP